MPVTSNGDAIMAIREKAGLSKVALANGVTEAGLPVTKQHIGDVEAGKRNASATLRKAIADFLHVPVTAIETFVPSEREAAS